MEFDTKTQEQTIWHEEQKVKELGANIRNKQVHNTVCDVKKQSRQCEIDVQSKTLCHLSLHYSVSENMKLQSIIKPSPFRVHEWVATYSLF